MPITPVTGHTLDIGCRVKINIPVIAKSDMDGIEFTASGKNYWRYMNQHPDEIYTVTAVHPEYDAPYELSGYMESNTWAPDELICLPDPTSRFEVIKNMTMEEMQSELLPMLKDLFQNGTPSDDTFQKWLSHKP